MSHRRLAVLLPVFAIALSWSQGLSARGHQAGPGKETILKANDITPKTFPERVFYRGQVASVQMRNTGGVHFGDDLYVLAGLVDVSGYSSGVREKYQGYLLTEVPMDVNGKTLKPGAFGIGFVNGSKFVVDRSGLQHSSRGRVQERRRAERTDASPGPGVARRGCVSPLPRARLCDVQTDEVTAPAGQSRKVATIATARSISSATFANPIDARIAPTTASFPRQVLKRSIEKS